MIKNILLVLMFTVCSQLLKAQLQLKMGIISAEEETLKECAFDIEAVAAVLVDEGLSDFDEQHRLVEHFYQKIKILKEPGLEYADVKLPYRSKDDFSFIRDVKALITNIDENGKRTTESVDKKSVYYRKINDYSSEVSFTFPNVKVGSIIEYSYIKVSKNYSGLNDWYFQTELPVYRSSYDLKIVPSLEITYLIQKSEHFPVEVKQKNNTQSVFFEMKNIPGLGEEPFMDSRRDYIQKVIFQTTKYSTSYGSANFMSSWKEVCKELLTRPDFGKQLKTDLDECDKEIKIFTAGKTDTEKMQLVFEYVRKNLVWNNRSSLVSEDGVRSAWNKKGGNSASVNLLLINLLRSAGLNSDAMLVSERGNGSINKSQPFIHQFDNVFAVVTIGGKRYYLDATDLRTPYYLTPYSILNTTAFIVNNKGGELVEIEEPELRFREFVNIVSVIDTSGRITGKTLMYSKDYAKAYRVRAYELDSVNYVKKHILENLQNVAVEHLKFQKPVADTQLLQQQFDFSSTLQSTGDYAFLNLNLFTGFEANPFISDKRFSNINFGYKKSVTLNLSVDLPENYEVDGIPKNLRLMNQDQTVSFTREVFYEKKENKLAARLKIDLNKSLYTVSEYAEVKEFFKKMVDMMNEQVVLKKKS